ncbi:MAG: hypothetical protein ACFBSD_02475 [Paracoccaceae bacterium]
MNRSVLSLLLTGILALPSAAGAQGYDYRVLHLIEDRHTHAIIRVSTRPEAGDPPDRGRAACNDVAALDRKGRNIALAFGRMFQRSGIHVDDIMTSRVCRNIEAARLLQIGPVKESALLDPIDGEEYPERRIDALLGEIDALRPAETVLLLTHAKNIDALTGETLAPGEGLVFRLPPFGDIEVLGRFDLPPH